MEHGSRILFARTVALGLTICQDKNIPFTIGTSSGSANLEFFIEEFKLSNWFDISKIAFDDGTIKGKPEPDIYLKAAKMIDIPTDECLVFEDAALGITSAYRAKIRKIIAVAPKEKQKEIEKVQGVSEVIENFYQVKKEYF